MDLTSNDRRGKPIAAAVVVLLVAAAAVAFVLGTRDRTPPQPPEQAAQVTTSAPAPSSTATPPPPPATTTRQPAPAAAGPDFGPTLPASDPVALDIPSIGVRARGLVDLAIGSKGELEAPKDFDATGWYAGGPTPGQLGPFVVGAHVDSKSGPAPFYRLGSLKPGATVKVTREDGTVASFVIDQVSRYKKSQFPTATVYGNVNRAEIRLITCGGAFDQSVGHYVDNIVAFGHLVG